jgi:uncharacterized repeat protein (TIGR03803 family)
MKKKLVLLTLLTSMTVVAPFAWAAAESVLYAFNDGRDGAYPVDSARLVRATSGALYGTAAAGGACQKGNVFRIQPNGTESTLYSFCGSDGANPNGSLIVDASGTFYGTTYFGGGNDCGTVFKLSGSKLTRLHSFTCGSDGSRPAAGVIQDAGGNIYGTTFYGGNLSCNQIGCGVVYEISASGKFFVIHTFCSISGCADGSEPLCDLAFDPSGNILGTTAVGGSSGSGTVFKLSKTKRGKVWNETVLHNFNGTDGEVPHAGLTVVTTTVHGKNRTVIFGVAAYGGTSGYEGNVFQLTPSKSGYSFEVLYNFTGSNGDGAQPLGPLTWVKGRLFGTTSAGGDPNCLCGTVFELSEKNNLWSETILHAFAGTDGNSPDGGLVADPSGHLYGTTYLGGVVGCQAGGCGVVFKVTP